MERFVERFAKGDVVPFPFSDLTSAKRRPALVISVPDGDDLILSQITSQRIKDRYAIPLNDGDFETGGLRSDSNVRPNRLFTADKEIILYRAGHLRSAKMTQIIDRLIEIIRQ